MYIYKKTDCVVPESCDEKFADLEEKNKISLMLINMIDREKLVNLRRHIEVCDLCNPPTEVFIMVSEDKRKLSAGELLINVDGKNYIISTKVVHNIQIHNCKPSDEVISAIKKYYAMKY